MRRTPLALLALLLCVAVGHAKHGAIEVKLYTLDCGRIDINDMDAFADDGSYAGVSKTLVVACYLIRHPKGDLLWDAGVGDQFAGPKGVTFQPGYIGRVPVTLRSQLQRLGLDAEDVTYIGFSHEHADHIGNANAFAHATWLLNRREHEWTIAHDGRSGEPPALLSASKTARVRMIDRDVDLFRDGSVTVIQAPGHTPGHQVLLVKPTGGQPVILAGDLWHSRSNYAHDRVPRFNTSRGETVASFSKVRELARKTGAAIWIEHEPADFHPLFDPIGIIRYCERNAEAPHERCKTQTDAVQLRVEPQAVGNGEDVGAAPWPPMTRYTGRRVSEYKTSGGLSQSSVRR